MSNEKITKKQIEVVSGNGSELDISPVYDHINVAKPKNRDKKPKNIVVPGQKKKDNKNN